MGAQVSGQVPYFSVSYHAPLWHEFKGTACLSSQGTTLLNFSKNPQRNLWTMSTGYCVLSSKGAECEEPHCINYFVCKVCMMVSSVTQRGLTHVSFPQERILPATAGPTEAASRLAE